MLVLDEVTYAYGESSASVPVAHGESAASAYGESAPVAHGESVAADPVSPAGPVLSDVTLSLSPGEFVGIAGASASGKTTLLRLAAGRIAPTSGTVTVDGIASDASVATRRDITRIVSLCHQLPERQLFAKTLWADVAFGPANLGVTGENLERRIERALVSVGFDAARARQVSPFELSGGERRRAAIAGALAMEGRYLLLDEPTAGLDAASRDMLMGVLAERAASGTAVVVVSHDLELLAAHADRIVVLGPAAGAGGAGSAEGAEGAEGAGGDSARVGFAYDGSAYDESGDEASAHGGVFAGGDRAGVSVRADSAYADSAPAGSAYAGSTYGESPYAAVPAAPPHAAPSTILADGPASEVLADTAMLERAGLVQPLLWRLADVLPAEFSPAPRPASGEAIES